MTAAQAPAQAPEFGAIIIGDELMSGRREDQHMAALIERLDRRGLELSWARLLGDDPALITRTLTETFATDAVVFSFGGIGATPDDRTRQCCARALGVDLARHAEAERELRAHYGEEATEQRLRMVEFPEGAAMIPNPVNRVAGFGVKRHYFLPGFPRMAWPMVEWVLDHHYASVQAPGRTVQRVLRVRGAREGELIPLLERMEASHPELRVSCLPDARGRSGHQLELGLRGAPEAVAPALDALQEELRALGYGWELLP